MSDAPKVPADGRGKKRKRPDDSVDEASEESFPASDPPGFTPGVPCNDSQEE